jgi:excisionase family DNA binding protein
MGKLVPLRVSGPTLADRIAETDHALSVKELCALLGMGKNPLYEMAADGRLPSIKIGANLRFDPAITAAWLRERYVGVTVVGKAVAA